MSQLPVLWPDAATFATRCADDSRLGSYMALVRSWHEAVRTASVVSAAPANSASTPHRASTAVKRRATNGATFATAAASSTSAPRKRRTARSTRTPGASAPSAPSAHDAASGDSSAPDDDSDASDENSLEIALHMSECVVSDLTEHNATLSRHVDSLTADNLAANERIAALEHQLAAANASVSLLEQQLSQARQDERTSYDGLIVCERRAFGMRVALAMLSVDHPQLVPALALIDGGTAAPVATSPASSSTCTAPAHAAAPNH
jgi:hypothetical protein